MTEEGFLNLIYDRLTFHVVEEHSTEIEDEPLIGFQVHNTKGISKEEAIRVYDKLVCDLDGICISSFQLEMYYDKKDEESNLLFMYEMVNDPSIIEGIRLN